MSDPIHTVDIVLAHHLCTDLVGRAVASILEQTEEAWRLFIVDDHSLSLDEWAGLSARWPDSRIQWLQTSCNVGQFRIYNHLLPALTAPHLMLHDADDTSLPTRLERQLAALADGGLDVVGCAVLRLDEKGHSLRGQSPHLDVNRALRLWRRGNVFIGPTMLARTGFVRRLGGFDGSLRIGGDTEFICRAVFAGRVANLAEPLYRQTMRERSLTRSPETGHGSAQRKAVTRLIHRRYCANQLRRWRGSLVPGDLVAPANDLAFTAHDLAGRPWPA